jgi:hypothetical protein
MKGAARAVLSGLIDYAGLFPPAGLSMPDAVRNYAAYQRRDDAWALARFVVPVARLAELEHALLELSELERLGTRWPLTALSGADPGADAATLEAFNARYVHGGPDARSLEVRAGSPEEILAIRRAVPPRFELYVEVQLDGDLSVLLRAVRQAGALAKVRMGGIRANEIPTPEAVLQFLAEAASAGLPFKATAGLHHPVRGLAPLTYEPRSACATLFGYLNVVLAAGALWRGRSREEALCLLTAEGRPAPEILDDAVVWGGIRIEVEEITRARREFVRAIGSCSFTEPLEEIQSL